MSTCQHVTMSTSTVYIYIHINYIYMYISLKPPPISAIPFISLCFFKCLICFHYIPPLIAYLIFKRTRSSIVHPTSKAMFIKCLFSAKAFTKHHEEVTGDAVNDAGRFWFWWCKKFGTVKFAQVFLFCVFFLQECIWVFPKIGGKPPKWMVYNGKPYEQMDDLGVPLFLETPRSIWAIYEINP